MTGPPYPHPSPAPGSNAIGSFAIGVSPIGDIPAFDPWSTIISQYANSPVLTEMILAFNAAVDPTENIDNFFDMMWNIYTAQGYGLDVWGKIVGVGRTLEIAVSPAAFFGFDEGTNWLGFGGVTGSSGGTAGGIFFGGGASITTGLTLSDADFRTLILAKAAGNISDGSILSLNNILLALFPNQGAYVFDLQNMTCQLVFPFALTLTQQAIIAQENVLPIPAGVAFSIVQQPVLPIPQYQGPGDVVPGAVAWWGLRGYSQAAANAQKLAIRLQRASDNAQMDFSIKPNGALNTAAIQTFISGTTATVVTLYDQTGNSNHLNFSPSAPGGGTVAMPIFDLINGISFNPAGNAMLLQIPNFTNNLATTQQMTQYCWFNPFQTTTVSNVIGIRDASDTSNDFHFATLGTGITECRWQDSNNNRTNIATAPYGANVWQMFSSSVDSLVNNILVEYMNGTQVGTGAVVNGGVIISGEAYLWGAGPTAAIGYSGAMNEGGFWDTVVTPTQMAALYTNVAAGAFQ